MTTTQVIVGENESLESALKRFKRKCQKDGIIGDIRRKVEYQKPSVAKKKKSETARKRAKKESRYWLWKRNEALTLQWLHMEHA